jgi:hypothetical protein
MRFGAVMSDIVGLEIHSQFRSKIMSARQKCKRYYHVQPLSAFSPSGLGQEGTGTQPEVAGGKRKPIDTPNRKKYPRD